MFGYLLTVQDVQLGLIFDDRVAHATDLVDLAAKVVVRERRQAFSGALGFLLGGPETLLANLCLPHASFLYYWRHVDHSVRRALNRSPVLLHLLHLLSDISVVDVGRNLHRFETFHEFFVLKVDPLCLFLLVVKVEAALLAHGSRAVNHRR